MLRHKKLGERTKPGHGERSVPKRIRRRKSVPSRIRRRESVPRIIRRRESVPSRI